MNKITGTDLQFRKRSWLTMGPHRFMTSILGAVTLLASPASLGINIDGSGAPTGSNGPVVLYKFNSASTTLSNGTVVNNSTTQEVNGITVVDFTDFGESTHGSPLTMRLQNGNPAPLYYLSNDYLKLQEGNVLKSVAPADKIIEKCGNSGQMTIEVWIENITKATLQNVDNEGGDLRPEKQSLRIVSLGDATFKEFSNFGLYLGYKDGEVYKGSIRTQENSGAALTSIPAKSNLQGQLTDPFLSRKEDVLGVDKAQPQRIILTRNTDGTVLFYRSDESGSISLSGKSTLKFKNSLKDSWYKTGNQVNFSGYDSPDTTLDENGNDTNTSDNLVHTLAMHLSFGNEPSGLLDRTTNTNFGPGANTRFWPWRGKLYSAAIYCRVLSENEILGDRSPNKDKMGRYIPTADDLNMSVTPELKKARKMYELLSGVSTPIFNPVLKQMAPLIADGLLDQAADLAIETKDSSGQVIEYNPSFYNIVVRDFAAPMSTREESVNTGLNDFIATIIGNVRDNKSAKELLTSKKFYMADPTKAAVPSNIERDILRSNSHYQSLEAGNFDLARVLKEVDQQLVAGATLANNFDAAGVLTSRAFMGAHAIAGTNRRLVEYAFREFECIPMEKWSYSGDTAASDYIGRDIDRTPGGSGVKFEQSCRACHSRMDPLRGAFAFYTFNNGFTKSTTIGIERVAFEEDMEDTNDFVRTGLAASDPALSTDPLKNPKPLSATDKANLQYVVAKMNHNSNVYLGGKVTTDNSFENRATDTFGSQYFGWRGPLTGRGAANFGKMLADSEGFSRCMTKRVFKSLCKRDPVPSEDNLIKSTANDFETIGGYQLKFLFKRVVGFPQCLGE